MGYKIILQALALVPKWLLVGLVACFFAYLAGVSAGREPYRLAAAVQDARAEIIIKRTDKIRDIIRQKGMQADETIKDTECVISDFDAGELSDIKAD